jgi:tRNA modification GTPase
MLLHLEDTIVALSSATGAGLRGVVRLSGPNVLGVLNSVFTAAEPLDLSSRRVIAGILNLPEVGDLPADLYLCPGPHTYTGQHLAELHTISSPPLLELLITRLLIAGARAAQPGEFTLRAFLAGKCDLPRAEAVLGVIEANDRAELTRALAQMAGGVSQPLAGLREDLLNLLADVEAGLDFTEEDIHFVSRDELLIRLSRGLAHLTNLRRQLDSRGVAGRPFRIALVGRPNAGKSSLFNALTAGDALVSPEPGTTRDYLLRPLDLGGIRGELIDTAGWQAAVSLIAGQAQRLGGDQAAAADLLLVCVAAGDQVSDQERGLLTSGAVGVATKCDLTEAPPKWLATSVVSGTGLDELRRLLTVRAKTARQSPLAPSLSRCRHHVEAGLNHLKAAHQTVLFEEPAEILALEVRGVLDQLGELVGAVYTDDLLDRVFSRFCIGK